MNSTSSHNGPMCRLAPAFALHCASVGEVGLDAPPATPLTRSPPAELFVSRGIKCAVARASHISSARAREERKLSKVCIVLQNETTTPIVSESQQRALCYLHLELLHHRLPNSLPLYPSYHGRPCDRMETLSGLHRIATPDDVRDGPDSASAAPSRS